MVRAGFGTDRLTAEWRHLLLLVAVYLVTSYLSIAFTRFDRGLAMIWIATGILAADLRHRPQYSWMLRAVGCGTVSVVMTTMFGLGAVAAVPMAFVNVFEAVGCAMLLNRYLPSGGQFHSPREIGVLVLVAGLIMPITTAFLASGIAHFTVGVPYWYNWLNWVNGHALGALTIIPMASLILGGDFSEWVKRARRGNWAEAIGLMIVTAITTAVVFAQTELPILFVPFLPILLGVFRFGRLGAAVGLAVLAAIGSVFTVQGQGPVGLIGASTGQRVQFFQLYLATTLLICLTAAAELKRRKQQFNRLAESTALYQVIADRTGDILMALEIDGTIRFASPSVRRLTGLDPDALCGRKAQEFIFVDDLVETVMTHRQAIAHPDETFMQEFRAVLSGGELGWFETHTRATLDEERKVSGVVSVIREVSGRKTRELDLAKAAQTDALTGVLNRRGFETAFAERLAHQERAGTRGCIAMFDLDHFKSINDLYGHATGDDVLRVFASLLAATVRGSDLVGRLGGEEFAVLLVDADIEQARAICDRILARFAETALSARDQRHLHATVSGGLALIPVNSGFASAIQAADVALYSAKAAGRNRLAIAA